MARVKKCINCKAWRRVTGNCTIGYQNEVQYMFNVVSGAIAPKECPQPKTNAQFITELSKRP